MDTKGAPWALILAAGEGSRLHTVTAAGGGHVPKQFCSFCSDRSLLAQTIDRAAQVVPRDRIVVVVAAEHRALWEPELARLPSANVVVQPRNRGTANGLLLGCMAVWRQDPEATLIVLPSDHHFDDEGHVGIALARARLAALLHPESLVLLGIEPDEPDTEYGWIVPVRVADGTTAHVAAFVEKPDAPRAKELMAEGALWSSFIMAGTLQALLALFRRTQPRILRAFATSFALGDGDGDRAGGAVPSERLERLYERLPVRDFSRHVLQACTDALLLLRVPSVGWSDLGTPARLQQCLDRRRRRSPRAVVRRLGADTPVRAPLALEAGLLATSA